MINITTETKNALHQPVKQVRARIEWEDGDGSTQEITSEDRLISMKKDAEGYYLKSTLRKITIVLTGTETNLLDQKIAATVEVKTGANTWGRIPWGSFTITEAKIDQDKGISTYTGYGGISILQQREYQSGALTFPTTVGGLVLQMADYFGITVNPEAGIIPPEYKQVEYIQSTTTQWVDTGVKPQEIDTMEADLTLDTLRQQNERNFFLGGLYNNQTSGQGYINYLIVEARENNRILYGWKAWQGTNAYWGALGTRHKVKTILRNGEQKMFLDGTQILNASSEAEPPTTTTTLPLMAYQYNSGRLPGYGWGGKIYSLKLSKGNQLVRNFIPCKRKSDNKPGLYDTVTRAFFTNAGTGEFTTGAAKDGLPNIDAPINEDLWANISGTTYRDVLEEIAGATGTIAVIGGGDDTLDFKQPPITEASETLTEANLITGKISTDWGKVSSVVLSRQPQNDNIVVNDDATAALPANSNIMNLAPIPEDAVVGSTQCTYEWVDDQQLGRKVLHITSNGNYPCVKFAIPSWVKPRKNYAFTARYKMTVGSTATSYGGVAFNGRNDWELVGQHGTNISKPAALTLFTPTNEWTTVTNRTPKDSDDWDYPAAFRYLSISLRGNYSPEIWVSDIWVQEITDEEFAAQTFTPKLEPFTPNGLVPLTIANNQILDEQRETTAQPILDAVKGWEYRDAEIKTEGHAYHEIGDRLDISVGGETYPTVVTKSTILVDGGINEILTSRTPETIPINYAKSGGISKTVYRTELEVDKQEQRIDSIVSRQDATDAAVQEQFTQVTQNINSIVATAQASGGGNLIMNSVGFGKDSDGKLTVWQYGTGATTTTVRSQSSPASLNAGAVSGHEIMMTGTSTISQTIALTPGEKYTLALRASKGSTGSATITLGNTSETATITLAAGTAYAWSQESVEFTPSIGANTLTITAAAGTVVEITDLILATGGSITWRQASGEIYNTQVSLDQGGVQVRSSVYTGDYVEITPLEFAGYSNAGGSMQKVFSLNRDTTEVEKLEARSQIKMPPIKIVPIDNASYEGWAFVKED